ncbi:DUF6452 family protein [Hallella colorans]|uniref:DUF6452 family protein n=1 Tax=Hallella colorans TaxID=1703337 RepID=UPI0035CF012E
MTHRPFKHCLSHIRMAFIVFILMACSSVDCPLNNTVYTNYKLMGDVTKLPDPLTILTQRHDGTDTILINQLAQADSFSLPMSYGGNKDVLYFKTKEILDTVWVTKTNRPHFESVDCGLNYFHTITDVRCTHNAIDSVVIKEKEVTYDMSPKHFYIYFKKYRF